MDRKLKILITDDSKLLRKKLRTELEKLDCEVLEAVNGKESVEIVLQQMPDCVFLTSSCPRWGASRHCRSSRR